MARLRAMGLTDLHRGFRDEDQRRRAAGLVMSRLGEERKQHELHVLWQFSSQLSAHEVYVDEATLADTVTRDKLAVLESLVRAVRRSYDAIDTWIATTSRPSALLPAEPRLELSAPVPADVDLSAFDARTLDARALDARALDARAFDAAALDARADGAAFRLAEVLEHRGELIEAAAMYRRASEYGDVHALYALGRVYHALDQRVAAESDDDRYRSPDWRITEVWMHAADLGLVDAMYAVAMTADPGSGLALRYLRLAADQDHPPAWYALGHHASQHGTRDEARTWWRRAAAVGHRPAVEALTLLDLYEPPSWHLTQE